jgi:hypothetical protein
MSSEAFIEDFTPRPNIFQPTIVEPPIPDNYVNAVIPPLPQSGIVEIVPPPLIPGSVLLDYVANPTNQNILSGIHNIPSNTLSYQPPPIAPPTISAFSAPLPVTATIDIQKNAVWFNKDTPFFALAGGAGGNEGLPEVLAINNNASTYDIDMNGQSIKNVANILSPNTATPASNDLNITGANDINITTINGTINVIGHDVNFKKLPTALLGADIDYLNITSDENIAISSIGVTDISASILNIYNDIDLQNHFGHNCLDPILAQDIATKNYVDTHGGVAQNLQNVLNLGNSAGTHTIDMNNNQINNLADPSSNGDAINLGWFNTHLPPSGTQNLSDVLLVGNSAGATSINMNGQNITSVAQVTNLGAQLDIQADDVNIKANGLTDILNLTAVAGIQLTAGAGVGVVAGGAIGIGTPGIISIGSTNATSAGYTTIEHFKFIDDAMSANTSNPLTIDNVASINGLANQNLIIGTSTANTTISANTTDLNGNVLNINQTTLVNINGDTTITNNQIGSLANPNLTITKSTTSTTGLPTCVLIDKNEGIGVLGDPQGQIAFNGLSTGGADTNYAEVKAYMNLTDTTSGDIELNIRNSGGLQKGIGVIKDNYTGGALTNDNVITAFTNRIVNVKDPILVQDCMTKNYADTHYAPTTGGLYYPITGGALSGATPNVTNVFNVVGVPSATLTLQSGSGGALALYADTTINMNSLGGDTTMSATGNVNIQPQGTTNIVSLTDITLPAPLPVIQPLVRIHDINATAGIALAVDIENINSSDIAVGEKINNIKAPNFAGGLVIDTIDSASGSGDSRGIQIDTINASSGSAFGMSIGNVNSASGNANGITLDAVQGASATAIYGNNTYASAGNAIGINLNIVESDVADATGIRIQDVVGQNVGSGIVLYNIGAPAGANGITASFVNSSQDATGIQIDNVSAGNNAYGERLVTIDANTGEAVGIDAQSINAPNSSAYGFRTSGVVAGASSGSGDAFGIFAQKVIAEANGFRAFGTYVNDVHSEQGVAVGNNTENINNYGTNDAVGFLANKVGVAKPFQTAYGVQLQSIGNANSQTNATGIIGTQIYADQTASSSSMARGILMSDIRGDQAVGIQTDNVYSTDGNAIGIGAITIYGTNNGTATGAQIGDINSANSEAKGINIEKVIGITYGSFLNANDAQAKGIVDGISIQNIHSFSDNATGYKVANVLSDNADAFNFYADKINSPQYTYGIYQNDLNAGKDCFGSHTTSITSANGTAFGSYIRTIASANGEAFGYFVNDIQGQAKVYGNFISGLKSSSAVAVGSYIDSLEAPGECYGILANNIGTTGVMPNGASGVEVNNVSATTIPRGVNVNGVYGNDIEGYAWGVDIQNVSADGHTRGQRIQQVSATTGEAIGIEITTINALHSGGLIQETATGIQISDIQTNPTGGKEAKGVYVYNILGDFALGFVTGNVTSFTNDAKGTYISQINGQLDAYGAHFDGVNATTGKAFGMRIDNVISAPSALNTAYGLYIGTVTGGAGSYGVYQSAGATLGNVFDNRIYAGSAEATSQTNASLNVAGTIQSKVQSSSATTYGILNNAGNTIVSLTGNSFLFMPAVGTRLIGAEYTIWKKHANNVTINGNGININGSATFNFSGTAYQKMVITYDGTEWLAHQD